MVAKTFTTAFSASCAMAGVGSAVAPAAAAAESFLLGASAASAARDDEERKIASKQPQKAGSWVRDIGVLCELVDPVGKPRRRFCHRSRGRFSGSTFS